MPAQDLFADLGAALRAALPLHDHALVFAICLGTVLLAPMLARRLRLPGLIGLLLAGLLLGPTGFGILARDTFIERLGAIGLLFILGLAGLELDLHEFRRRRGASLLFGSISFLLPQSLGTTVGLLLDLGWGPALLLGSILGSHTLLTYPIVKRLGIHTRGPVMVAVGGTMVTDTAALLMLAAVAGAAGSGANGYALFLRLGLGFAIFLAITFLLLPRLTAWAFRALGGNPPAEFLLVLALLFGGAWLSELAGVAPMVGAFMTGLALNRLIPDQSTLMNRLQFVGNTLFIPFFLFAVGMLVDWQRLLADPASWHMGGLMLACVVAGKGLAAWLSGHLLGFDRDSRTCVFGLTLAQAAATLAVVMIGRELGLLNESIFNGSLILIVGSCVLASWLTEGAGRRLAMAAAPLVPTPDVRQRLLVPLANPATADDIMALTLLLRDSKSIEPLHPLVVVRDGERVEQQVADGERLLSHAVVHAAATEVPVTPLIRIDTNIASAIVRAAKELRISSTVIGWNGHISAGERIFGSILDQVLAEAPPRILVARLLRPLPGCKRLVLVIPPHCEREPGFARSLRLLRNLIRQLDLGVEVWATSAEVQSEAARSLAVDVDRPSVVGHSERSWSGLRQRLLGEIVDDDLVVLLSAREGGVSWQPGLDRLPRLIASRHGANLVVVFPPLPGVELELAAETGLDARQAPSPSDGLFPRLAQHRFAAGDWISAVRALVDTIAADPMQGQMLADGLLSEARRELLQLVPGVVLLHAHTGNIGDTSLIVGISATGIPFPRLTEPVRLVLMLLSRDVGPDMHPLHLRRLATLAQAVRDPSRRSRMEAAEDDASLRRALIE